MTRVVRDTIAAVRLLTMRARNPALVAMRLPTAFVALGGTCLLAVAMPASGTVRSTTPCRDHGPGIRCGSSWFDSKHAWAFVGRPSEIYVTKNGGRKWLGPIFRGGNRNYALVPTSPRHAVVEAGNWSGFSFWTNDRGRFWYETDGFGVACYANCVPRAGRSVARAGRGNLLFWHDRGDTLYQVRAWPPVGRFPCTELIFDSGGPPPGHHLCRRLPDEAGLSSVPVARLDRGSAFRELASVPGGVAAMIDRSTAERAPRIALFRHGSLSLLTLPEPKVEGAFGNFTIVAPWPRIYVVGRILRQNRATGWVVWRSADAGASWTVYRTNSLEPRRARVTRGRARVVRTRTWFPGGFMARALVSGRQVLHIKQLGRARSLFLPGSKACRRIEVARLAPGWPELFVEGRRKGAVAAIWWSADAGDRWLRLGTCSRSSSQ
jgi:hypothetical protein